VSEQITNISEYISENFGANASYVEGLLSRYQADPNSVDESWRTFFGDLLNGQQEVPSSTSQVSSPVTTTDRPESSNGATQQTATVQPTATAQPAATAQPTVAIGADTEVRPLTGAAKKIVENMETSLTVPTATTFRNLPVKVLEENRRIINAHLQASGRGKVSFTHLIAWAIIKAVKAYPALNNGYGFVDGKPSRLENESINLGIAIDIEKKDGSRNLLVPNI